ncbi:MFS transporter [Nocardia sp. NBC_01388]
MRAHARSRALGAWAGLGGFAATLGVVLSGLLTEYASWRWCFLINVPVAIAALVVVPQLIPDRRPHGNAPARIDGLGAALITAAIAVLDLGLIDSGRTSGVTTALRMAAGVALLVAFVVLQQRSREDITGLASGLVATTQQLGGALGLGVFGALAIRHSSALMAAGMRPETALTQGFRLAFLVSATVLAISTVVVGFGISRGAGTSRSPEGGRLAEIVAG